MGTEAVLAAGTEAAVRQVRTGQAREIDDAFTAAVADHHRELARFAYRLCGDRAQAEDVVAEAYARVWPQWRRGKVAALVPYLMRTVANEVYGRHRRRLVEQRNEPPPGRDLQAPFESRVEERDALWAALDRLSLPHRVVVVLRVVEDLSEEETASMLGVPPGTVKSRLSRALPLLRSMLEAHDA